MQQIFSSHCFMRLKRKFADNASFDQFLADKVELVTGDLTVPALGMSKEDRDLVTKDTQIIINSAASVKFDHPLREALETNFWGAQRILDLAKECVQLEVMTHISTAYVNSNRPGNGPPIDEKIYWDDMNVMEHVNKMCG